MTEARRAVDSRPAMPGTVSELRSHPADGLDDHAELVPSLVDGPRLETTVGVDVHTLGRDQLERASDSPGHLVLGLDAVRVRVHDTESDGLRERGVAE